MKFIMLMCHLLYIGSQMVVGVPPEIFAGPFRSARRIINNEGQTSEAETSKTLVIEQ